MNSGIKNKCIPVKVCISFKNPIYNNLQQLTYFKIINVHLRLVACSESVQSFFGQIINGLLSPYPTDLRRFLLIPFCTKYSKAEAALLFDNLKLYISEARESV